MSHVIKLIPWSGRDLLFSGENTGKDFTYICIYIFSKLLMEISERDLQRIGPFDERFGPESLCSQGLGRIR